MPLSLLRRSLRQFRRQPLFSFVVAGTLALAVAAATASFAVVKRAFFDPLPYRDADRLVSLLTLINGDGWAVSAPVFEDMRAAGLPIEAYAPIDPEGITFSDGRSAEQIGGAYTSASYFSTLGIAPALGRAWQDGERQVAVVSWEFWQRSLGGATNVVGRAINVNGTDHTVVGVLPQGYVPPYFVTTSVWMPLDLQPLMAGSGRARRTLTLIARVAPGSTVEELNVRLASFSAGLQQRFPNIHGRQSWVAEPLRAEMVGSSGPVMLGTGAAAGVLVLIVLANVTGLSAARAIGMRHDAAVRLALGATRGRLFRERLIDSLVLSAIGAVAGVWLGDSVVAIVASYQQQFMPRLAPVSLDLGSASLGVLVGLLTGIAGAFVPNGAGTLDPLRGARAASAGARVTALRSGLVAAQVALALVLIVGAGLLVRTVHHLTTTSLGFGAEGLSTFTVTMPVPKYAEEARQLQYEREMLERLGRIPGVRMATASVGFPVVGGVRASLSIQGRSDESGRGEIAYMSMAPGFMQSVGMRLTEGRDLTTADHASAPLVVVINETMARQYWPDGDAIGARTRIGPGTTGPWITVVGVVADVRYHGPTQPVMPTAFGSTLQYSWPRRHFTVRTDGGAPNLGADLRAAVRAIDPDVPMGPIQTVDDMVGSQTARHRLVMFALTFFGVVAVALCAGGLYGVVALSSQMRRREYAIRMALGAASGDVRWMVVRQAVVVAAAGATGGVVLAALGTRALAGLLHGVQPMDGVTFAVAITAVLGLSIVSAWLPARAAGRIEPSEALGEG